MIALPKEIWMKKASRSLKKLVYFLKIIKLKLTKYFRANGADVKIQQNTHLKNFETFNALNSFYDEKFVTNEAKQIKDLKNYIKNWNSDKNLVLITHFVVISSILNTGSSSGEIIVSDKNFNIIGSIDMM